MRARRHLVGADTRGQRGAYAAGLQVALIRGGLRSGLRVKKARSHVCEVLADMTRSCWLRRVPTVHTVRYSKICREHGHAHWGGVSVDYPRRSVTLGVYKRHCWALLQKTWAEVFAQLMAALYSCWKIFFFSTYSEAVEKKKTRNGRAGQKDRRARRLWRAARLVVFLW